MRRLPLKLVAFFSLYIVLISLFIIMIFSMPKWLKQAEVRYTDEIQIELSNIFKNTEEKDLVDTLIKIREESPLEIIVVDTENKMFYGSIPGVKFSEARALIPEKVAVLEAKGEMIGKDKTYLVWYTIYRPNAEYYIRNLLSLQMFFVLLSFLVILTVIYFLYRHLIKPLKTVREAIGQLEEYDLDAIKLQGEDEITEGMQRFAVSLKDNIETVSRQHTKLEYALQLERERLQNMITVSRGIIHDLKSPIYQTMLENEAILHKNEKLSEETEVVIKYNVERLDSVMKQISEVLKLMSTDVKEMIEIKNIFDFTELVKEIRLGFIPTLEKKELWLTVDLQEDLTVHINKVVGHLIIHNMLSNAIQYANDDSEIELIVYAENNVLHITTTNETTMQNMERIQNSDNLFQAGIDDMEHTYSTGNGIYLIRELTNISQGSFSINIEGKKVIYDVEIPID